MAAGSNINPMKVALALARGATQLQAYQEGRGVRRRGAGVCICNRPEVVRYRDYFLRDEMDRLMEMLKAADCQATAVLTGEVEGVTRRDVADAWSYAAQRERTHTAVQVEIGHRIEFTGLRGAPTGERDVLEVASIASQERIDAPPATPALPESTSLPLTLGDTPSPSEVTEAKRRLEDTAG